MTSPTPNVKNFDLNDDTFLDKLENSLSVDRFRTYLTATDGDRVQAVRLYTWNTAVSAAFYGPLQALEVALRNAMDRELAVAYGRTWYDSDRVGLRVFPRYSLIEVFESSITKMYASFVDFCT